MSFLLPLLPYLLALAGLVGGYLYADRACWSTACESRQERITALEAEKVAAIQRATDLANLYAATLDKVETAAKTAREERAKEFAALEARARRAGANRTVVVSSDSARLWDDASRAGNGEKTAPAGVDQTSPAVSSVSEADLNEFITKAAAAYRAVDDARLACIALYEGTQ